MTAVVVVVYSSARPSYTANNEFIKESHYSTIKYIIYAVKTEILDPIQNHALHLCLGAFSISPATSLWCDADTAVKEDSIDQSLI